MNRVGSITAPSNTKPSVSQSKKDDQNVGLRRGAAASGGPSGAAAGGPGSFGRRGPCGKVVSEGAGPFRRDRRARESKSGVLVMPASAAAAGMLSGPSINRFRFEDMRDSAVFDAENLREVCYQA